MNGIGYTEDNVNWKSSPLAHTAAHMMFGTKGACWRHPGKITKEANCDTWRCFTHPVSFIVTHETILKTTYKINRAFRTKRFISFFFLNLFYRLDKKNVLVSIRLVPWRQNNTIFTSYDIIKTPPYRLTEITFCLPEIFAFSSLCSYWSTRVHAQIILDICHWLKPPWSMFSMSKDGTVFCKTSTSTSWHKTRQYPPIAPSVYCIDKGYTRGILRNEFIWNWTSK